MTESCVDSEEEATAFNGLESLPQSSRLVTYQNMTEECQLTEEHRGEVDEPR